MQDVLTMLNTLHRPRLMMRAARIGAEEYRRSAHLPRLLGYGTLPRHGAVLLKLMDIEATLEEQRIGSDGSYSLIRHLDVLIAMVAEARVLQRLQAPTPPQGPASLTEVT
ncbi:hypothetical protein HKX54_04360 [Sulfitobacter sp. M57]|uniref:DUF6477 family protein n=1 Tax=unclassified Sulfitobacter TaxID=196795 RepID=UPI0023E0F71F|nr:MULTISPECIES: DUF6477 family protein [unclassified Sulfitobacter]MDF3413680.1 hypothetical protein [Sulfitobacter sp. KE5]MDF3421039.1 hypothetical protein [Sulfitobacter sp. KE43]MDF3432226.1 hypothetical protein [Sulfitobacter sp. KE42]MDF3457865.1 hypothetical protein [Sulfitobacter sp. S74]MDF3461766.1 hypothetical protein [Sulfitobacter sp. Ks18]